MCPARLLLPLIAITALTLLSCVKVVVPTPEPSPATPTPIPTLTSTPTPDPTSVSVWETMPEPRVLYYEALVECAGEDGDYWRTNSYLITATMNACANGVQRSRITPEPTFDWSLAPGMAYMETEPCETLMAEYNSHRRVMDHKSAMHNTATIYTVNTAFNPEIHESHVEARVTQCDPDTGESQP